MPTGTLMDQHHHRGRKQLLLLRSSRQFDSAIGRRLFGLSHEIIVCDSCTLLRVFAITNIPQINKCLVIHERPEEQTSAWAQEFSERGPAQEAEAIHIRTAQTCAEAQVLFDTDVRDPMLKSRFLKLIEDAEAIDTQYQDWIEQYSNTETWGYQILHLAPEPALPADGIVQVYHDFWTAYIWTSCRSKRAHLHEVVLHCLFLLGCPSTHDDPSANHDISKVWNDMKAHPKDIIETMISGICAAVPFMLGDINSSGKSLREKQRKPLTGYKILWPLNVALASTRKGSIRDAWIRERLRFIDAEMGVRLAGLFSKKAMREPWILN